MVKSAKKSLATSDTLHEDTAHIIDGLPSNQNLRNVIIPLIEEGKASSTSASFSSSSPHQFGLGLSLTAYPEL